MNSTLYTIPVTFIKNSIQTTVESWFIPFDIFAIVCLAGAIIIAIIFLFIIAWDKTCHTVPMILVVNICLTELISGGNIIAMSVFTLQNDIKQIQYQDSLCIFRGYFSYSTCAIHCYSYLLTAIYQYMTIVHPTRLFWQTAQTQILLVSLSWIIGFVFPILFLFIDAIVYDVDNQICQVPLGFSFSVIYAPVCVYVIPVVLVFYIYFKLVRYVKQMGKRLTPAITLFRAQRDLKMVHRTVILILILFISGFPYTSFVFLSFANRAPKYNFRIAYIFVNLSMLFVMIALFQFTDPVKASVKKLLKFRPNMVVPSMT